MRKSAEVLWDKFATSVLDSMKTGIADDALFEAVLARLSLNNPDFRNGPCIQLVTVFADALMPWPSTSVGIPVLAHKSASSISPQVAEGWATAHQGLRDRRELASGARHHGLHALPPASAALSASIS